MNKDPSKKSATFRLDTKTLDTLKIKSSDTKSQAQIIEEAVKRHYTEHTDEQLKEIIKSLNQELDQAKTDMAELQRITNKKIPRTKRIYMSLSIQEFNHITKEAYRLQVPKSEFLRKMIFSNVSSSSKPLLSPLSLIKQ